MSGSGEIVGSETGGIVDQAPANPEQQPVIFVKYYTTFLSISFG